MMNKRWKIKKEIEIGRGSEIRESNPPHRLGKPVHYRCANLANLRVVLMFWNRKESHERDSNPRPTHYECVALPTEPSWLFSFSGCKGNELFLINEIICENFSYH